MKEKIAHDFNTNIPDLSDLKKSMMKMDTTTYQIFRSQIWSL